MSDAAAANGRRPNRVQSVKRALAVLSVFDDARPEMGVSELARTLGLSKSIVMRLVSTLREAGFLERGIANDKYRIGLAAFEVGSLYFVNASLRREAEPVLHALAERFACSTYIGTLSGDRAVYVSAIEGSGPIRIGPRIGSSAPAHTTAAGKALLAYLDPDELERYLATAELVPETPHSISTRAELRAHLLQIRAAGFATNRGEHLNGVAAVGAPVFDARGAAVAAISLAFPIYLMPDDQWPTVTAAVVDAAQQISRRLGTPAYMTSGATER
jgi:DNA-binding IclR family transcriptional regulator